MAVLIFIVDDMKMFADSLAIALGTSDIEVEKFYHAKPALDRASNRPPDILITDIEMPGMDGISLAQAISKKNPYCKILLMSANQSYVQEGCQSANPEDSFAFIQKPFPLKQLRPMIDSLMKKTAAGFHC